MFVVCLYRPPSQSDFMDQLLSECENLLVLNPRHVVMLGDLNSDLPQTKALVSIMRQLNLTQLVQNPTRITASSSSFIDVILTNSPECFCNTFVHPFGFSDHHLVHSHLHARGLKVNRNKSKIV